MRRFFLVLIVFCSLQFANAQSFQANVFAGLTSSQISGDGAYGFVQFGVMTGGEVVYSMNDQWSTTFGIRFNQKGSRIYKSNNNVNTYRLRVNYIEAPLLINFSIHQFSIGAGPVLSVKINQRERTQFGEIDDPRIFDPIELAAEFNIGYELRDRLSLRLLYQNSILAVRDHPVDQAFPPALFVLGSLHQKMLNQGQYFTSLSLLLTYTL